MSESPQQDHTHTHEAVEEEVYEPTLDERTESANRHIRDYTLGAMAIGLVPIPFVDLAALFSLELKLLHSLARTFDIEFRADAGRAAIGSLVSGSLSVAAAPAIATTLGKLIPGVGTTVAAGSQMFLNGALTYALGKVFMQHFSSGGTFLTFDPEMVRDYFTAQVEEGKRVASQLHKERKAKGS